MGLLDWMSGNTAGGIANWLGTAGDGMGIASAFTDGKTSDGLGLGSGLASIASSLMGIGGGIGSLNDAKNDEDKSIARWDIAENAVGVLGGMADSAAGISGLAGSKKGQNISNVVSGSLGILGGLISGGRAIYDLYAASKVDDKELARLQGMNEKDMTEREKKNLALNGKDGKEKAKTWNNLFGGAMKIFGGITNIGSGASGIRKGNPEDGDQGWETAGKVSAVAGAVPGLISSILGSSDMGKD